MLILSLMTTFVGKMEAKIKHSKSFEIPEELEEAYFVAKGVSWRDYRTMPLHLIEKCKAYWYLESFAQRQEK